MNDTFSLAKNQCHGPILPGQETILEKITLPQREKSLNFKIGGSWC